MANPRPFIVFFDDVTAEDRARIGNKGYNLGRLSREGIPVPPGFCVTVDALDQFLDANAINAQATTGTSEAGADVSQAVVAGEVPPEVIDAILAASARLGGAGRRWAVRSSALGEDGPEASFAGQYESFLNIPDGPDLIVAVVECWASFWKSHVDTYQRLFKRPGGRPRGAVVVQQMVDADVSGIMFTANPTSLHGEEVLLSVTPGLGAELMRGAVQPDEITARRDGVITQYRAVRDTPILEQSQVTELVALGLRIEALFGTAQDIEWCLQDGRYWIVQARPAGVEAGEAAEFTLVDDILESYPTAVSPFTRSLFGEMSTRQANLFIWLYDAKPLSGLVREFDGYYYIHEQFLERLVAEVFGPSDVRALARNRESPIDLLTGSGRQKYGIRGKQAWSRLARGAARIAGSMLTLPIEFPKFRERYLAGIQDIQAQDFEAMNADGLDRVMNELLALIKPSYRVQIKSLACCALALRWVGGFLRWRAQDADAAVAIEGVGGLDDTEAVGALRELAAAVRADPELLALFKSHEPAIIAERLPRLASPLFHQRMDEFLREFGHFSTNLGDVSVPRFQEDTTPILRLIRLQLAHDDWRSTGAANQRERSPDTQGSAPGTPADRLVLAALTHLVRIYTRYRENTKFHLIKGLAVVRRVALTYGKLLVDRGVLDERQDVFYLEMAEIRQMLAGDQNLAREARAIVVRRRKELQRNRRTTPPRTIWVRGKQIVKNQEGSATDGTTLVGVGASPGVVTAPASVIVDASAVSNVQPGTILVLRVADPTWVPLFGLAAGLVIDVGSRISHGSIIARELGLPAVVGVRHGTERIKDGQHVTVDGTQGIVRIHDDSTPPLAADADPERLYRAP